MLSCLPGSGRFWPFLNKGYDKYLLKSTFIGHFQILAYKSINDTWPFFKYLIMISNYFLIAFRNLKKNLLHSSINITGLGIGIAAVIMISSYVRFELSYDRYLKNYDRIYRISLSFPDGDLERSIATNYPVVHRTFPSQFPEIEKSTRLYNAQFSGSKNYVRADNEVFPDQRIFFGDSTFFDVFQFNLISGNSLSALRGADKVVITEEVALRYFGSTDCIGKLINLNDTRDFMVSGVMDNIPINTHFHFDVLATMENHPFEKQAEWNGLVFATYFLLQDYVDPDEFSSKIGDYLVKIRGEGDPASHEALRKLMPLIPLKDIHLNSHREMELEANGNSEYVILFTSIAVFILLIACINYINLATSNSLERAREVGLRKIFGAYRSNLIYQFLGESLMVSFIAFILALGIIELFRPYFNGLVNMNLNYGFFFADLIWLYYILFLLVISLFSGLYPAMFLSRFMPEQVLKGKFSRSLSAARFKKALVVFQFYISIFLIIGSLVVYNQLEFMLSKNLGIDKEHIVAIPFYNSAMIQQSETIKEKMREHHSIINGTAVSQLPISIDFTEGVSNNMNYSDKDVEVFFLHADRDFFGTMGLELSKGNQFTREYSKENTEYIVNRAAMHALGENQESLFNRNIRIKHGGITLGPIVGLVDDFNFASLHEKIGPLVISQNPSWYSYLLFKLRAGDPTEALTYMNNTLKEIVPGMPFEYKFLDQEFDNIYKTEIKLSRIVTVFTILAIFIACIGLFGLSAYDTMQRTKEIGVRKVMGSSTLQVVYLFLMENIKLIFISMIIGIPSSYWIMNIWLRDFAYRKQIDISVILVAMIITLGITLLTVTYHTVRAALINPSRTLRYE
jgi:putative ABC transport system permease protein